MLRSSSSRGQTEPLAALVAIAAVCIAVGMYAAYVSTVLPATSDRDPAAAVLKQVWNDAGAGGVYHQGRDSLGEDVRTPDGYTVYIEITTVTEDGHVEVVEGLLIRADGERRVGDAVERPADPETAIRPIGVQQEDAPPGDVGGGTLRVEVWNA